MFELFEEGISNNSFAFISQLICGICLFVVPSLPLKLLFLLLLGALAFCYEKEVEDEIQ